MKKLNLIITILLFSSLWGQSKLNFNYSLEYAFYSDDQSLNNEIFTKHYIPSKFSNSNLGSILFLENYSLDGGPGYVYLEDGKSVEIVSYDLNYNFKIKDRFSSYDFYSNPIDTLYQQIELVKSDIPSKKILDRSCNNYLIKSTKDGEESTEFMVCIDETNEIDNLSFIFPKQQGKHIKGLILQFAPYGEHEKEGLTLRKIENIDSKIQFDFTKEFAKYVTKRDSLKTMYEMMVESGENDVLFESVEDYSYEYESGYANQPSICQYDGFFDLDFETDNALDLASNYLSSICSISYYMKPGDEDKYKSFVLRDAKTATKNFRKEGLMSKKDANIFLDFIKKGFENLKKADFSNYGAAQATVEAAAEATVEAAEAIDYYDYAYGDPYVVPYESTFKTISPETVDFAVSHLEKDSPLWKSMPNYCQKLDSIIPNFSNAELKLHAKNYAGQICDMYLGEFSSETVWYKGTLDAIRAEHTYFSKIRGSLNSNDTKLLDEFLNSLD